MCGVIGIIGTERSQYSSAVQESYNGLLKLQHRGQGVRMSAPWNVAAGAEGALQNVPMMGVAGDAAKVQSIDAKSVRGPEAGTDVLATADVVQDKADRQPFRLSKRFSREALSEALSRHYLMRRL